MDKLSSHRLRAWCDQLWILVQCNFGHLKKTCNRVTGSLVILYLKSFNHLPQLGERKMERLKWGGRDLLISISTRAHWTMPARSAAGWNYLGRSFSQKLEGQSCSICWPLIKGHFGDWIPIHNFHILVCNPRTNHAISQKQSHEWAKKYLQPNNHLIFSGTLVKMTERR